MQIENLTQIIDSFERSTVVVVGDIMLDEYFWGDVERISPEAPVPVLNITSIENMLGGAGNVAKNLLNLGCTVMMLGVIGDDDTGEVIIKEAAKLGLDPLGIQCEERRLSSRKTRLFSKAHNQQIMRFDQESKHLIGEKTEQRLLAYIANKIGMIDGIIIADYLKGCITPTLAQAVIRLGNQHHIPVIVDPKGNDKNKYRQATALTPNIGEAEKLTGESLSSPEQLLNTGFTLQSDLQLTSLLLTRGAQGISLFSADQHMHIPAQARQVYDVSGAGDTVVAVFTLAVIAGATHYTAACLANLAAGIVVGKVGTATVSKQELLQAMHQGDSGKILAMTELQQIVTAAKLHGKKVVFTNGCFDLLHIGHVEYLRKAKTLGDLLVIGLNSDQSVKRLKGETRPIVPQQERAAILAALDIIDYITVFDEDTPYALIAALKPDVLVKGADYTPDQIVGRDLVESNGGELRLIEFVNGKSTSALINKIQSLPSTYAN